MVKVKLIVFMLTALNLLNWVDRGLIAGAGTLIKGCVENVDLCGHTPKLQTRCEDDPDDAHPHVDTCSSQCRVCGDVCPKSGELVKQTGFGIDDFVLGIVQSSFMIGYMGGSFLFSRAAHNARVYRILAYGMIVWTLSTLISGFSGFLSEYTWSRYVLTFGRIFSGVGEAALATVALPHLDDILPEEVKGRYMALYFAAMPVGNALGFVFAGVVSEYLTWKWTFLIEAMLMPPFIIIFLCYGKLQPFTIARHKRPVTNAISVDGEDPSHHLEPLLVRALDEDGSGTEFSIPDSPTEQVTNRTLLHEIVMCLKSPTFVLASAGFAMYTFTIAGLGFYMPLFLQTNRPCDQSWRFSETKADALFGLMVLTSGFIGVLAGGAILDISPTSNPVAHAMKFMTMELCFSTFMLGLAILSTSVTWFFVAAWFGTLIAFMSTVPMNRALLGSVPLEARSVAMALSVVIGHLFGDVPSPILIGAIADAKSPSFALGAAWCGFLVGTLFWLLGLYTAQRQDFSFQDH